MVLQIPLGFFLAMTTIRTLTYWFLFFPIEVLGSALWSFGQPERRYEYPHSASVVGLFKGYSPIVSLYSLVKVIPQYCIAHPYCA